MKGGEYVENKLVQNCVKSQWSVPQLTVHGDIEKITNDKELTKEFGGTDDVLFEGEAILGSAS